MGIGTLRQHHSRPSNLTTIKDILGEAEEKTAFVSTHKAPQVVAVEQVKPDIKEETFKKIIDTSVEDVIRFDNESPSITPTPKKDRGK